jgi:tape measure domain-containing protein
LATQFAVDLVFKSQTQQLDQVVNKVAKFERDLARLKGADPFQGVEDSAKGAGREIDRTKQKADAAAGGFSKLGAVLGRLAIAYTAIQATKYVFGKTAELETQTRSIQVLVGSLGKAKQIVGELQQYANVTPFTSSEIIESAKRLTAFGVSAEKVVDTTKRLGDVAGVTGANLGELSLAYGQVMAKGRLAGEELLQFQERGIALQDELRKMYGLSGDEFADAMRKGQISAEAVEIAVKRLTDAGGKYANGAIAQSDTLAGKLSTLQDAFETLAKNIGTFFEPVFKWMLDAVTKVINRINDATVMQDEWRARSEADQRTRNRFGARALNPFDREAQDYKGRLEKSLYNSNRSARAALSGGGIAAAPAPTASKSYVPPLLSSSSGGSSSASGKKAPTGRVIEYLTGDKSSSGYRADHGGNNYHEHLAFQTAQQMQLAMKALQAAGIKVGSTTGGRHAPGSYHYSGQALDVPASQVPVGQEQMLSKMVREVLAKAGFVGQGIGGEGGSAIGEILADYRDKLADSFKEGAKLTVEMQRQLELMTASDEHARKLLEIENEYQDRKVQINELLDKGQQTVLNELNDRTRNLEIAKEEVSVLYEKLGVQDLLSKSYQGGSGAFRTDVNLDPNQKTGKLAQYMTDLQTQLNDTEGMITSLAGTVESELGSAMSNAIVGLIDGTQTAEQAFSQMFKNIGKAFIDMATQMIAKAIVMKILGIAFGGGGGGGGLFSGAGPVALPGGSGFAGGFSMPKLFAEGGYVTGPTSAVIGEGGQSEYVIPASKMSSAMANYKAGKRGDSILSDPAGDAAGDTSGNNTFTLETVVINNVEYATVAQVREMGRHAARQGAEGGYNKTMGSLKNSRSQRSRIGLR